MSAGPVTAMIRRLKWYLRQLVPTTYRTTYRDMHGEHFAVWRMWWGRVFDYEDVVVSSWYRRFDETSRDKPLLWHWRRRRESGL